MNKRLMGVLIFALVIAGAASLVLYRMLSARMDAARQNGGQVWVATHDLAIGTLVKDTDIRTAEWSGPPPQQSIAKPEDIIGRGVIAAVYTGEPILESRLAARGAGAGMAATIPVGMRATAIRVNEVVGVAGFVVPGMRVDVLILGTPPMQTAAAGTASKTLLQNIEVLSAGQQIQKDTEGKPISVAVVNLLVTPEQAEILSLASNDARIQLVLRNPLDTKESKTGGAQMARLWAGQGGIPVAKTDPAKPAVRRPALPKTPPPVVAAKVEKPEPPPPPLVVEVLHGGTRTQTKFQQEAKEK